jgi:indolepyruvate ferredoxin oxidoreductase
VRIAPTAPLLHQVRIDTQQADAVLACDAVVAASPEALQTIRHGRTRMLVNVHETPIADAVRHPDTELHTDALLDKMRYAAGQEQVETFDTQQLAERILGDTLASNILALGYAWQRGLVPVGLLALEQALRLNGVAVESNLLALAVGRLAAAKPQALKESEQTIVESETLTGFIEQAHAHLQAWQNAAWADRYSNVIAKVQQDMVQLGEHGEAISLTVARSLHKLMSYKDEYEVGRLFSDAVFQSQLDAQFEGDFTLSFHLSPPAFLKARAGLSPRKITLGAWLRPLLKILASGKVLRGTVLDIFGYSEERRMERQLIIDYQEQIEQILPLVTVENIQTVHELLKLPMSIRGFGHVKARNAKAAQIRRTWLLNRLDPNRFPRPHDEANTQQLRGIAIRSDRE